MPLLVKEKTKTKPNPPNKKKNQPLFSYLRLHSFLCTLKSIIFSDTLHAAATKRPDMVLPFVPSHSVGLVPWAFQTRGLCL